jgi:quercetin dioxygenase-like cupin family protein
MAGRQECLPHQTYIRRLRLRFAKPQAAGSFPGNLMSLFFPTAAEMGRHTIFPGVNIRTCAADKMLVAVVDLEPRSVVTEHSHHHEQVGMVLQGRLVFTIGGETKTLGAGEVYRIPGGVKHKVVTLDEPAKAIDIFSPVREEYL